MSEKPVTTPFAELLSTAMKESPISLRKWADFLKLDPAHLSRLAHGEKNPTPRIVNSICDFMGRGPKGRKVWHEAAAKSMGWEI